MKWRSWAILFALCGILIALTPHLAEARAGGSYRLGGGGGFMSQGSRGFFTHQYNGGAPLQRSITSPPGSGNAYGPRPGYGYGYGHPFMGGLLGGFMGSWLGSMLFPGWGMGWGHGSMFGSVFSWFILMGLVWLLMRLFSGRGVSGISMMGTPYGTATYGGGLGGPPNFTGGGPRIATLGVTAADYHEFEGILKSIQTAWSHGDLAALRQGATPEMLSYFAEELAANQSHGVVNRVEDIELIRGEVRQAWDEGDMHYATALLHWRARDYTIRSDGRPGDGDIIVGGDPQRQNETSEMWTFVRCPGGRWLLAAIQQV